MTDKNTYVSQVKTQIDEWHSDVQKINKSERSKVVAAIKEVEDKVNAFEKSDDKVPGHWETEIDNLRHQVDKIFQSTQS